MASIDLAEMKELSRGEAPISSSEKLSVITNRLATLGIPWYFDSSSGFTISYTVLDAKAHERAIVALMLANKDEYEALKTKARAEILELVGLSPQLSLLDDSALKR